MVNCGRAEGVSCPKDDLVALALELLCQFAYGGGLSDSVHTHHEDDIGLFGEIHRLLVFVDEQTDFLTQIADKFVEGHKFVLVDTLFKIVDNLQGGVNAHIGLYEGFLHSVQGIIINPRLACDGSRYPLKETYCHNIQIYE